MMAMHHILLLLSSYTDWLVWPASHITTSVIRFCVKYNIARASFDTHWKENQGSNAIWMLIMYLIINLIYICYLQCRHSQKMMTNAITVVSWWWFGGVAGCYVHTSMIRKQASIPKLDVNVICIVPIQAAWVLRGLIFCRQVRISGSL
jgi:hypothetical protein